MVAKVTTGEIVHNEIEILSVLKCVVHVDDEGILELSEDLSFVDD